MLPYTQEEIGIEILRAAQPWVDAFEVVSNATWGVPGDDDAAVNAMFRAKLRQAGHAPGWPYCMTAVKAWWTDGYAAVGASPDVLAVIAAMFTPSVVVTYNNVRSQCIQSPPPIGSIMFQRLGSTGNGHAGVVNFRGRVSFSTIEANTSSGVAKALELERNGDGVYIKPPKPLTFKKTSGLWTMGFLPPFDAAHAEDLAARFRRRTSP